MTTKNPNAIALGKLAKGYPKTMSPAAIEQRLKASMAAKEARKAKEGEKSEVKLNRNREL